MIVTASRRTAKASAPTIASRRLASALVAWRATSAATSTAPSARTTDVILRARPRALSLSRGCRLFLAAVGSAAARHQLAATRPPAPRGRVPLRPRPVEQAERGRAIARRQHDHASAVGAEGVGKIEEIVRRVCQSALLAPQAGVDPGDGDGLKELLGAAAYPPSDVRRLVPGRAGG